jgi:hypothetical protein
MSEARLVFTRPQRPTPLAFPLLIERIGAKLSSESLAQRLERMRKEWEKEAAGLPLSPESEVLPEPPPPGSRPGRTPGSRGRRSLSAGDRQRLMRDPRRFGGPGFR